MSCFLQAVRSEDPSEQQSICPFTNSPLCPDLFASEHLITSPSLNARHQHRVRVRVNHTVFVLFFFPVHPRMVSAPYNKITLPRSQLVMHELAATLLHITRWTSYFRRKPPWGINAAFSITQLMNGTYRNGNPHTTNQTVWLPVGALVPTRLSWPSKTPPWRPITSTSFHPPVKQNSRDATWTKRQLNCQGEKISTMSNPSKTVRLQSTYCPKLAISCHY